MKLKIKYFLCLLLVFSFGCLSSQNSEVDSLKKLLKVTDNDTNKVFLLNKIARQYCLISHRDSSFYYAKKSKVVGEKLLLDNPEPGLINSAIQKGIAQSYNIEGLNYTFMGDYVQALFNLNIFLELSKKNSDKKGIAAAYGNIGNVYYDQGRYPETLELFLLTLKIREEIKDRKGLANSYVSLGNVYNIMHNYSLSIKYYGLAVKLFDEFGDRHSLAGTYNNIAGVYTAKFYYTQALKMYFSYLEIMKEFDDQQNIATTYGNIANIYFIQKKYTSALELYLKSLEIQINVGDKSGQALTYISIGETYLQLGDFKKADFYEIKGLELSKEQNEFENLKHAYSALYSLYETTGKYKKALENYKLSIIYRDSISNKENTELATRIEMNYEFDKKLAADKLEQSKKDEIGKTESKRQQIIIWAICGVLFIVICFAVFVYRSSVQKQKANLEIIQQKHIIEEKQKEILDSIYYARRIQRALLTSEKYIDRNLNKLTKKL